MRRLAFITYADKPAISADDERVAIELRKRGFDVVGVPWDDASGDAHWQGYDAVVARSPWNYHRHAQAFGRWIERMAHCGVTLLNPPRVLRWNMHKFYLRDLEKQGFQIPETYWAPQRSALQLARLFEETGWQRAVIKPAVSATAFNTLLIESTQAGQYQANLDTLISTSDVLVQKFMPAVRTKGEWSLLFFDKVFSHAVVKRPKPGDFRVQNDFGGTYERQTPDAALVALGMRLLQQIPESLPYARIDGIWIDGAFYLMELELIEPMLFLEADAMAPQRFATAILKCLKERGTE